MTGSGWLLQWRSWSGWVCDTRRCWSEREAESAAIEDATAHPGQAAWIVGPRGGERFFRYPVRPWFPDPSWYPGPIVITGWPPALGEPGTPRAEAA